MWLRTLVDGSLCVSPDRLALRPPIVKNTHSEGNVVNTSRQLTTRATYVVNNNCCLVGAHKEHATTAEQNDQQYNQNKQCDTFTLQKQSLHVY